MKRNHLTYRLIWLIAAVSITACTSDELAAPAGTDDAQAIELTGTKSHIITRAGDDVEPFEVGTRYWLHGVSDAAWTEATEDDNHTINYGTVISFSDTPMNFYGVTYGNTTDLPEQPTTDLAITERVAENKLPDLMYSNNLTGQTLEANGYRLQMDFEHAMSRLKFMIVKQDESEDAEEEKKLEDVKLKKIVVKGTHGSGTLNIVQGTWSYTDNSTPERTYYENTSGIDIATTSQAISPTNDFDFLIFPNEDKGQVTISVTLSGITGIDGDKTVDYKLRSINEEGTDMGVFRFEQNHEYTLLITVLKDDVRTIAIAPQVYEWIDKNENTYLGQPVTFANLMWMDRNLGAKSADCYNDWENCRGYYYQYGRNIPYILDMDKYEIAVKGSSKYEFLYTYNQYGEKVYGGLQANSTKEITMDDGTTVNIPVRGTNNIAINPGDDVDIYEFIYDSGSGVWLYEEDGSPHPFNNTYWMESSENHPCPKGWRLPTKEDFATFLPDYTFKTNPWYEGFHHPAPYTGDISKYPEEVIYGTVNGEKAFYLIKRQGRTDCYRIRILLKASKDDANKQYYEFAYFTGDEKMTFDGISEENQADLLIRFDWSTPSAIMEIPSVGFIHPHREYKLDGDGVNAILRTSQTGSGDGTNWVFYLRNDWQFGLINGSRRALGDQIRCVRDVTVNKD